MARAGSRLPKSSKMLISHNGGNEHDSSTIAQERNCLLKFKNESFGAVKNFSVEISPEMNQQLTGNEIFRPRIESFED